MLFSPPRYRSRLVVPVRFTVVVTFVPSIITFGREKRSGVRSLSGGKAEHLTGVTAVPSKILISAENKLLFFMQM